MSVLGFGRAGKFRRHISIAGRLSLEQPGEVEAGEFADAKRLVVDVDPALTRRARPAGIERRIRASPRFDGLLNIFVRYLVCFVSQHF